MGPRIMANETILIVDDAPVSLKLTDILLRKEGYTVHATKDAEQALSLLTSVHPDMMLVDIQLPGMDGLELTKRVKQDSRTRDIVVVALTACAMKGDDDIAFKAGCDGYITKPIETLTLANKVRGYLERRTVASSVPADSAPGEPTPEEPRGFPGGITLTPSELESVRRRFLEEGLQQAQHLLGTVECSFDLAESIRIAHDWMEAARALDYPALAGLAAEAEKLLRTRNPDRASLSDALSNVLVAFAEPPEATMRPVPTWVDAALRGKNVALVGFGREDGERLGGALKRASAKPRFFDAGLKPSEEAVGACSMVVVNVLPGILRSYWLHPLTVAEYKQPLVLIGVRDHLLELDSSILPRASDLLVDGWQPEEALLRMGRALARAKVQAAAVAASENKPDYGVPMPREVNRESEVLLADDDLTVRMVTRSLLQNAGIKCRMACDGTEALQAIRDCVPAAAILDINMPGMDGYEVLAAVRSEMLPVRIILLTARQQEADITRGFTLGADDYVVKPFNPSELLARVKRYL